MGKWLPKSSSSCYLATFSIDGFHIIRDRDYREKLKISIGNEKNFDTGLAVLLVKFDN